MPSTDAERIGIWEDQLEFWRALLAPFPDECLSILKKGGKELTYVDKRSLSNRLDSVCGPQGWDVAYRETERGFICRIGIYCKIGDGSYAFLFKEDGGGHEGMVKTKDVEDEDNDEKSAYTNAFRRAAQDAWGIGRYLYRKGIPTWLDPSAEAVAPRSPEPPPRSAPPAPRPAERPSRFDYGYIPEAGVGVFPWIKEVEKHFHVQLWPGVKSEADAKKYGISASTWKHDQVQDLLSNLIRYCKTLPQYKGEFDSVALTAEVFSRPTEDAGLAVEKLAKARASLARTVKALVERRTGGTYGKGDLIAVIGHVASMAETGEGQTGVELKSLAECTDAAWIANMVSYAEEQLAKATEPGGDDDIPF